MMVDILVLGATGQYSATAALQPHAFLVDPH